MEFRSFARAVDSTRIFDLGIGNESAGDLVVERSGTDDICQAVDREVRCPSSMCVIVIAQHSVAQVVPE